MEVIDRKYQIKAVSGSSGKTYTEADGVFFKASDAAFDRDVLDIYKRNCALLGAHPRQIQAVKLLIERVEIFKKKNPASVKVPDVDAGDEEQFVNKPNESTEP